ncbi:MAG: acetate/propionate family kinase [Chloroflexota bacterium]
MTVLVVNTGSSSLKASVIDDHDETLVEKELSLGDDASVQGSDASGEVAALVGTLGRVYEATAVGHRVVHGGPRFVDPVLLDEDVLAQLGALRPLAPLHQSVALGAIAAARSALPDLPHVAVFDTAFHATLPEATRRYPVPWEWERDHGVRRYGFHGIAVSWAAERAAELLHRPATELGLVVAHLGSGCSVTAVAAGRSIDTTMGMTPLEGLMMGTRAGSIDPGVLLHLLRSEALSLDELADALDHRSGLLAIEGTTAKMQQLEARAEGGNDRALLAIEMFTSRAAGWIAAMATALPRFDALVFSGGIGLGSALVRSRICARLGALAVPSLASRRAADDTQGDAVLARTDRVAVLRVKAREDIVVARATRQIRSESGRARRSAPQ